MGEVVMRDKETHDKFKRLLAESRHTVRAVCEHLMLQGHFSRVRGHTVADSPDDWKAHSDGGDIEVLFRGQAHVVEVKQVNDHAFTSADNFPWAHVGVENVPRTERRERGDDWPICWYVLNKDRTHAAIIAPKTRVSWIKKPAHGRDGVDREIWCCPVELVHFVELKSLG